MIDIDTLSIEELRQLQADVADKIESKQFEMQEQAMIQIRELANEAGLDLMDIASKTKRGPKAGTVVPAKYKNPENPEETWTGRGRKPRWLAEKIDNGANLDDFLI